MVYRMKGRRFLKMYTAPCDTPCYAANTDAKAAAEDLDDVPWSATDVQSAQMSYHTNAIVDEVTQTTGLDMNVSIRESFDAALFCANHKVGLHRAYANAACYVFELPEMETYPNLVTLTVRVTSDPYNSAGVRLAVHLSDTLELPQEWSAAREGIAYAAGAAPRVAVTGSDGKTYWYSNTESVEIDTGSQTLKRYLLLMVGLEDYTAVRGDWMEGSAYIEPAVEIETDGELTGWTEGRTETAVSSTEYTICDEDQGFGCSDTVTISGDSLEVAAPANALGVMVACDYAPFTETSGRLAHIAFIEDRMERVSYTSSTKYVLENESFAGGAGAAYALGYRLLSDGSITGLNMIRKKLLIPFVIPPYIKTSRMCVSWTHSNDYAATTGTPTRRNIWIKRGDMDISYASKVLQRHELYTASLNRVGDWELLKSIEGAVGDCCEDGIEFDAEVESGKTHTILLTCYIDMMELEKLSDTELTSYNRALGDGWMDPAVQERSAAFVEDHLCLSKVLSGGWAPKITVKS